MGISAGPNFNYHKAILGGSEFKGRTFLSLPATKLFSGIGFYNRQFLATAIPFLAQEIHDLVFSRTDILGKNSDEIIAKKSALVQAAYDCMVDRLVDHKLLRMGVRFTLEGTSRIRVFFSKVSFGLISAGRKPKISADTVYQLPAFVFCKSLRNYEIANFSMNLSHSSAIRLAVPGLKIEYDEACGRLILVKPCEPKIHPEQAIAVQGDSTVSREEKIRSDILFCLHGRVQTIEKLAKNLTKKGLKSAEAGLFEAVKAKMFASGELETTCGGIYFRSDEKERLIALGELFCADGRVFSADELITELDAGRLQRQILVENSEVMIQYKMPDDIQHEKSTRLYLGTSGSRESAHGETYIPAEQEEIINGYMKILYGIDDNGQRVAIVNNRENRSVYQALLIAYEKDRMHKQLGEISVTDANYATLSEKIEHVAAAIHDKQPLYVSYYRARKAMQIIAEAGDLRSSGIESVAGLVLSAMVGDLPRSQWPKPFEIVATTEQILAAKKAGTLIFDGRKNTEVIRHSEYLATTLNLLELQLPDITAMSIYFVNLMARAAYRTEQLSDADWSVLHYVSSTLASRYRLLRVAASHRDAELLHTDPKGNEIAVKMYRAFVGIIRKIASRKFELAVRKFYEVELLPALAKEGVTPDEIELQYSDKSNLSIFRKIGLRKIKDYQRFRIILKLKPLPYEQSEAETTARGRDILNRLHPMLSRQLQTQWGIETKYTAEDRDDINNFNTIGQAGEFQRLRINGEIEDEKGNGRYKCEFQAQTEADYLEGELAQGKTHEERVIQLEMPGQIFPLLPVNTLKQLSLSRAKDLKARREAAAEKLPIYVASTNNGGNLNYLFSANDEIDPNDLDKNYFDLRNFPLIRGREEGFTGSMSPVDMFFYLDNMQAAQYGGFAIYEIEVDQHGQKTLKKKGKDNDSSIGLQSGDVLVFYKNTEENSLNPDRVSKLLQAEGMAKTTVARYLLWRERHRADFDDEKRQASIQRGLLRLEALFSAHGIPAAGRTEEEERKYHEVLSRLAISFAFPSTDTESLLVALGIERRKKDKRPPIINSDDLKNAFTHAWVSIVPIPRVGPVEKNRTQTIEIVLDDWRGLFRALLREGVMDIASLLSFKAQSYEEYGLPRISIKITNIVGTGNGVDEQELRRKLENIIREKQEVAPTTTHAMAARSVTYNIPFKLNSSRYNWETFKDLLGKIDGFTGASVISADLKQIRSGAMTQGDLMLEVPSAVFEKQKALKAAGKPNLFDTLATLGEYPTETLR